MAKRFLLLASIFSVVFTGAYATEDKSVEPSSQAQEYVGVGVLLKRIPTKEEYCNKIAKNTKQDINSPNHVCSPKFGEGFDFGEGSRDTDNIPKNLLSQFEGMGWFTVRPESFVRIEELTCDGPARDAGLRVGDELDFVDYHSLLGATKKELDEVIEYIKSKEEGDQIILFTRRTEGSEIYGNSFKISVRKITLQFEDCD